MVDAEASGPEPHQELVHDRPLADDAMVPWRIFLIIGVLVAVIAAIYWFTAYEDAGTTLLVLTAGLGLWCGVFLWLQYRRPAAAGHGLPDDGAATAEYLPHASIWPFAIGLGAALVLNGLVLGVWVIFPGVLLLGYGVVGFIRQSRRRD
jgi:Cytochrome c oxidase subunit IV